MDQKFIQNMVDAYFIDNNIYEDETKKITKDAFSKDILNEMRDLRENDLELYDRVYNMSRTNQNFVIRNYLSSHFINEDTDENSELVESFTGSIVFGGAILLIMRLLVPHKVSNTTFKALERVSTVWQTVTKWMAKFGSKTRVRYAIVKQNTESCYKRCGVRNEDMTLSHYSGVHTSDPWWGSWSNLERRRVGECLRECFLNTQVESINLYMENYFECLKKSGVNLQNADDDLMKFVSRMDSSHVCQDFHSYAKKLFDNFEMTLNMVFSSSEDKEKQQWYNKLKEKLYKTRQKIERQR